jgi:protein-disulfide isomerase
MTTRTHSPHPPSRGPRPASPRPSAARYRVAWWTGIGVAVALVVAIVTLVARGPGTDLTTPTGVDVVAPGGLAADGAIALGDGPVAVTVYFDYLCPACAAFEHANGDELDRLVEAGDITVELRPIAFLDHLSAGTSYSTRSANALATVADADPALVWSFHRALYADQPAEGGEGHTDEQLAEIARSAGVPDAVSSQFADHRYSAWVAEQTERALADGIQATPTILVDGQVFAGDPYSPGPLTAAVDEARG